MGYLVFNLCLSSLVLPLDTTEKSSAFLILPLIGVYKHRTDAIEPSLLKAPTSHSLSSYEKCSNPLLTSINFSWPCCSNSLSLLGPVLGSPLQHSGWLSRGEGCSPSVCWWCSSLCSEGCCGASLLQGHTAGSQPACCPLGPFLPASMGLFLPSTALHLFPVLNFMRSLLAHSSACQGFSECQDNLPCISYS